MDIERGRIRHGGGWDEGDRGEGVEEFVSEGGDVANSGVGDEVLMELILVRKSFSRQLM